MAKDFQSISPEEAMRLANAPAGQQLIAILKEAVGPEMQDIAKQAAAGNMDRVKQALEPLLNSSEIQKLIQQLGGK
ncbi:MAG: hypothetical protein IKA47_13515 [Oscillospiraceae bacterium]|nr:hypothetical protein [Oscillospiraceae bacterium]